MQYLILSLVFISASSFASVNSQSIKAAVESQSSCQNFLGQDGENIYLGFGEKGQTGSLRIVPVEKPAGAFELATADGAIDSVKSGSNLFVLTHSGLEQWDLNSKKRTAVFPLAETPRALGRYKNKVIIAHGLLGVSFFDLNLKKVTGQYRLIQDRKPMESFSTAVAVVGPYAYVILDSESPAGWIKSPFRGVVVIDMESEKVVTELDGLDPGADSVAAEGNRLVVGFGGSLFWTYSIDGFKGKKLPKPELRLWQLPMAGHLIGRGIMDENYYYTCYLNGSNQRAPQALDRKLWHFN